MLANSPIETSGTIVVIIKISITHSHEDTRQMRRSLKISDLHRTYSSPYQVKLPKDMQSSREGDEVANFGMLLSALVIATRKTQTKSYGSVGW